MYLIPVVIIALDLMVRIVMRTRGATATGREPSGAESTSYLRILVNTLAFAALAAAVATSFNWQPSLTGDRLIWHVTAAPVFALAGVAVVIFWAHRNRFASTDAVRLTSPANWAVPLRKFFFWLAVAFAVPALLAILAAMFPLFGTDDQPDLVRWHRYCAQLGASAAVLFAYFALVTWRDRSSD